MHFRLRRLSIIDGAERNTSKLGKACGLVPKRRTACRTEHSESAAGIKFCLALRKEPSI
jgi:hypothetical protein